MSTEIRAGSKTPWITEFQCPEMEVGGAAISVIPQVPLGNQSDAEEEEEGMKLDFTRQGQSSMLGLLQ